jgi:hypothetical protein
MADLINLNKARKARAKAAAKAEAVENRIRFGRTRQDKEAGRAAAEKLARDTDAHKREP